jgi:hypothetical protein
VSREDEWDKRLCRTAAQRLADRRDGGPLREVCYPDDDSTGPNIDLLARDGVSEIAIEHTTLETFQGQIRDNVRFKQLLADMTDRVGSTLPTPGHYQLAVPIEAVAGVNPTNQAKDEIVAWVRTMAPTLPIPMIPPKEKNHVAGIPPHSPLAMILYRLRDGSQGVVHCVRAKPQDLAEFSALRAIPALGHKADKLETYRSRGATTVLSA